MAVGFNFYRSDFKIRTQIGMKPLHLLFKVSYEKISKKIIKQLQSRGKNARVTPLGYSPLLLLHIFKN